MSKRCFLSGHRLDDSLWTVDRIRDLRDFGPGGAVWSDRCYGVDSFSLAAERDVDGVWPSRSWDIDEFLVEHNGSHHLCTHFATARCAYFRHHGERVVEQKFILGENGFVRIHNGNSRVEGQIKPAAHYRFKSRRLDA
jgi:hypothetical protein